MKKELCEITKINEQVVHHVQQEMPELKHLTEVAKIFKALADQTRLKIAFTLTHEEALCVCDVAEIIGSSVATASHHLRYLKDNGLAKSHRLGKQIYYSLSDDHVYQLVTIAYEHAKEVKEYETEG